MEKQWQSRGFSRRAEGTRLSIQFDIISDLARLASVTDRVSIRVHAYVSTGDEKFRLRCEPARRALLAGAKQRPFPCASVSDTVASMSGSPVELRVGGQLYRVVASADEADLRRLADIVDAKLRELTSPGRQLAPQSLLLAAIALAHELEEERERRIKAERRWREKLTTVLARVDAALDATADLERSSGIHSSTSES